MFKNCILPFKTTGKLHQEVNVIMWKFSSHSIHASYNSDHNHYSHLNRNWYLQIRGLMNSIYISTRENTIRVSRLTKYFWFNHIQWQGQTRNIILSRESDMMSSKFWTCKAVGAQRLAKRYSSRNLGTTLIVIMLAVYVFPIKGTGSHCLVLCMRLVQVCAAWLATSAEKKIFELLLQTVPFEIDTGHKALKFLLHPTRLEWTINRRNFCEIKSPGY